MHGSSVTFTREQVGAKAVSWHKLLSVSKTAELWVTGVLCAFVDQLAVERRLF